jgi:hypothetical protein
MLPSALSRLLLVLEAVTLTATATSALGQSPELSRVLPLSARPGETVSVTLHGKDLLKPLRVWTSFKSETVWETPAPGKDGKIPKPDGKSVTAKLSLAADAPLGVGFLHLPTETGCSGPLLFLIEDLALTHRSPKNTALENAQSLILPTAVESASDTGGSHFYLITPKQGEPFSAEIYAARLGSKLDAVLRLLDVRGVEIARADDTPGLAGDCHLRFTPQDEAPLLLEIRDATFAGGPDRFYHLRIGDFPLVQAAFPPVAEAGTKMLVEFAGPGADTIPPAPVQAPLNPHALVSVPARFAPEKPAALAQIRVENGPVVLETKAQGAAGTDTPQIPSVFAGRLTRSGERDSFQIKAKKDDRFAFTPLTREVGSPALLYLAAHDEKGAILAENDAGAAGVQSDVPLNFVAPRDGTYKIIIEDVARRGGAAFIYGLRIEKNGPLGFELSCASDRFVAAKGGSFTTKVTAQRRGVKGPITLELDGCDEAPLPPELRLEQNVLEAGKNETMLRVEVPGNIPSGTLFHLRIVGKANEGGQQLCSIASGPKTDANKAPKDQVTATLLSMPFPPRLLRESFTLCVGPDAPDFFKIELTSATVELPRLVGRHSFVLRQTALDEAFDANAQLKFVGLPEGVAIRSEQGRGGRIKGQIDFICEITGPEEIAAGAQTFEVIASATFKGVHKEVRLPKVPLLIVHPLGVTGSMSGPLSPGSSQKLKIVATRYDDANPQPITLSLNNLPAGVSGPDSIRLSSEESETTVELRASAGLPEQSSDSLVISALTRVKDTAVSLESAPVHLEVKK